MLDPDSTALVCSCTYFQMFALVQRVHVVHVKDGKVVQMTGEVDQPVLQHAQQELQQHSYLHYYFTYKYINNQCCQLADFSAA